MPLLPSNFDFFFFFLLGCFCEIVVVDCTHVPLECGVTAVTKAEAGQLWRCRSQGDMFWKLTKL